MQELQVRPPSTLSARSVSCSYGDIVAVRDVTLEVAAGQCVALVGESGSGKTTLLRSFNRMVTPTRGEIRIDDVDVTEFVPETLRRRIGYVPQHGGLLPHWTVLRNVALVPRLLHDDSADHRAEEALERVGLPADVFRARYPRQLSGGQRQRVALARAVAASPGVLLLDESFGALDAITRADVHVAFAALRRDIGITTLLVTHDLAEAALLADRIAVMRAGRIEQVGTMASLTSQPHTRYVQQLLEKAAATQRPLLGTS
jgi:osmoprotectant transport system ATP-binding protein